MNKKEKNERREWKEGREIENMCYSGENMFIWPHKYMKWIFMCYIVYSYVPFSVLLIFFCWRVYGCAWSNTFKNHFWINTRQNQNNSQFLCILFLSKRLVYVVLSCRYLHMKNKRRTEKNKTVCLLLTNRFHSSGSLLVSTHCYLIRSQWTDEWWKHFGHWLFDRTKKTNNTILFYFHLRVLHLYLFLEIVKFLCCS